MKACLIFACLALFVAAALAEDCNPDGNGMPTCTGTSDIKYRNFWDPTRYWTCVGTTATTVLCPSQTGFYNGECVSWSVWDWVPPCPQSA